MTQGEDDPTSTGFRMTQREDDPTSNSRFNTGTVNIIINVCIVNRSTFSISTVNTIIVKTSTCTVNTSTGKMTQREDDPTSKTSGCWIILCLGHSDKLCRNSVRRRPNTALQQSITEDYMEREDKVLNITVRDGV